MPDLDLKIGNRSYQINCQPGEEPALQTAASLMDEEVTKLVAQGGRMPEARLLLLAGLILADRLAEAGQVMAQAEEALVKAQSAEPVRVEVPVIPAGLADSMAELAARAEALAAQAEEKAAQ
ncbi:cell division protein ZapA [Actibacterium pelagium]|uniref:Cell division protein ZapA n=1 Tax=Actibacterium pelagium TaxID=2029103 RepID=A0A917AEA2_9RHOB|nr:cell division protein ZapA [Actibacterium pelagium]GGE45050.1 cell division protein ZapA [Actibacterium pelagium]